METIPIGKRLMRVLVIVHGFPPAAEGGTEVYAEAHTRALQHAGDEVLVVTREQEPAAPEYRVRRESRDGLSIAWINNTFSQTHSLEASYRHPAIGAIVSGLVDEFKPDIAHIHHLTCLSTEIVHALAQRGVPRIFTLHDYWLMCHRGQLLDLDEEVCGGPAPDGCHNCLGLSAPSGRSGQLATATARGLLRHLPTGPARVLRGLAGWTAARLPQVVDDARLRVDHMRDVAAGVTHLLAPSHFMRDRFIGFGVAPDRITTVALGVDHAPFQQAAPARTASPRLRLGFLGTLMVSKAPHLLLEAFSRLPKGSASVDLFGAYAAYHGDDRYRRRLDSLTGLEGVTAHGAVSHDRVVQALAEIDVLVLPSIWPENSPLVIREAFLAGVPVVASAIGGIPEAVTDGRNGLLFKPGDIEDLHRVLLRLIEEPELLSTLRAGIPAVQSIEEDVRVTRGLYELHVARTAAPPPVPRRMAAIVLHYRTPDDTWLTVRSLLASRRPLDDIIVVNNDVSGATGGPLPESGVTMLATGRNLGFSGGMNAGIRAALARGATHLLLVNSDVIVPPDCVRHLERCLDTSSGVGIAGPVVLDRSDPARVTSLGMSYTRETGRMRHHGCGVPTATLDLPAATVVDGVAGCLTLIRREVCDAIGLLDEDYFFGFEDLDFCLRARAAGFTTVVSGPARVHHEGGRSIGAESPRRLYFAARNHLLVAGRTDPAAGRLRVITRASSIVALNLAHAVTARGGSLPARVGAVMRGTRDYFAGRLGSPA